MYEGENSYYTAPRFFRGTSNETISGQPRPNTSASFTSNTGSFGFASNVNNPSNFDFNTVDDGRTPHITGAAAHSWSSTPVFGLVDPGLVAQPGRYPTSGYGQPPQQRPPAMPWTPPAPVPAGRQPPAPSVTTTGPGYWNGATVGPAPLGGFGQPYFSNTHAYVPAPRINPAIPSSLHPSPLRNDGGRLMQHASTSFGSQRSLQPRVAASPHSHAGSIVHQAPYPRTSSTQEAHPSTLLCCKCKTPFQSTDILEVCCIACSNEPKTCKRGGCNGAVEWPRQDFCTDECAANANKYYPRKFPPRICQCCYGWIERPRREDQIFCGAKNPTCHRESQKRQGRVPRPRAK